MVDVPMPDADGKITIDFEQLFSSEGEGDIVPPVDMDSVAPGEEVPVGGEPVGVDMPMDAITPPADDVTAGAPDMVGEPAQVDAGGFPGDLAPEGEEEELPPAPPVMENFISFKNVLAETAMKINTVYHGTRVSDIVHESLKNRLFSLLENLDALVEGGKISSSQAKLNEKRLEFLFLQLKEAKLSNSYHTEKDDEDNDMTKSLKEYAAKLFENEDSESLAMDSVNSGDTGLPTNGSMTDHAKKESGISPEVDDLFKEEAEHDAMSGGETTDHASGATGSVDEPALPNADGGKTQDKPWEEGEPDTVNEEVEAEGHAGFGDSDESTVASPDMFFEIDESELMEAIRAIKKESASKKGDKPWEKGKPAGKSDPSKKNLKKESMMDMGMEEDLVLNVELPSEVEDELDVSDLDVDFDLSGDMDDMGDEMDMDGMPGAGSMDDLGGDDMGSDMDDMGGMDSEMSGGFPGHGGDDEEEEVLLSDEEDDGMDEMSHSLMESKRMNKRMKKGLLETRKVAFKYKKLAESTKKLAQVKSREVQKLKSQLQESNLFMSKLVCLNDFLQREGLSRKVKQQIVSHLDRATTVAECKAIYTKIKNKLDESAVGHTAPVVGSASKSTTAGSAKLNESNARGSNGSDPIIGTFEKWQILANIKSKKED